MPSIKETVRDILTEKEQKIMPTSFDIVGELLIFSDFPKELEKKEKKIGMAILVNFKNIKTVLKKTKNYGGTFRLPRLKIIAGKRKKETLHKENNARFLIHPEKVYFSMRLATERMRIAHAIKDGENVLVMFSGCGVYPIVIAKNAKPASVLGVELNPHAHSYAEKNIHLNKTNNVSALCGDARTVVCSLKKTFDRILMPLPKDAESFLDVALCASHRGTIIHFYDFVEEKDFPHASIKKIERACAAAKKNYNILTSVLCGQYAPGSFRACIDFSVQ